ncbi:MAG: LysR substrate-binding domain-containing protein, partial [Pseudomonadota bacterium]
FERHSGGVVLTAEGQRFRNHARDIEASVMDAVTSMRRDRTDVTGRVRLGVTFTISGYFLFPLLARFRRAHPGIEIDLIEQDRVRLEQMLQEDEIDLALMLVSNLSRGGEWRKRVLLKSPRSVWLSSAHPLADRKKLSIQDVAAQPYVQLATDETRESTMRYWSRAGLSPKIVFQTTSLEAVREMVASGAAVTILSNLVYRPWALDGGRVEMRALSPKVPTMDIGLAWHRRHVPSAAEQRFTDYLVATQTA